MLKSNILYNIGRVVSYTVIGALAGAVGSVLSFSGALRGIVVIVVGIAMLVMAFSMLGIFSPVKFTPTETGTIPFTCWMGMIRSQINVVS